MVHTHCWLTEEILGLRPVVLSVYTVNRVGGQAVRQMKEFKDKIGILRKESRCPVQSLSEAEQICNLFLMESNVNLLEVTPHMR